MLGMVEGWEGVSVGWQWESGIGVLGGMLVVVLGEVAWEPSPPSSAHMVGGS